MAVSMHEEEETVIRRIVPEGITDLAITKEFNDCRLGQYLQRRMILPTPKNLMMLTNDQLLQNTNKNSWKYLLAFIKHLVTQPLPPGANIKEYNHHKCSLSHESKIWLDEHRNARSPGRKELLEAWMEKIEGIKEIQKQSRGEVHLSLETPQKKHNKKERAKAQAEALAKTAA